MRVARLALGLSVPALLHIRIHIHIHQHFTGSPFDYVGLALAAGASWIGVPGPGEPVLIASGVLAARHKLDITSVILVAFIAATAGGTLGWLLGRVAGRKLLTAPGPLMRLRLRTVKRGEEVFARHPVIAVVLAPTSIAGIHGVRAALFLPINAAGALLWSVGFGLGAYFIGPSVIDAVGDLGLATGIGLGLLVASGIGLELRRRRARARAGSETS